MLSIARSLFAATALYLMAGAVSRADILILANGDRLKGTLVQNVDNIITFKSDILGEIIVPTTKAQVEIELTPEQKEAQAKAAEEKRLAEAKAAEEKKAAEAAEEAAKPRTKKRRTPPKPPPSYVDLRTLSRDPSKGNTASDTGWYNQIKFGFVSNTGRNDKFDLVIDSENSRKTPKVDLRFTNSYMYSEAEGVKSTNWFKSNLRLRRTISTERLFAQSNTRYERNTLSNIACDAEQGLGLGYNVLRRKTVNIAIGSDIAERYRLFVNETATDVRRMTTVGDVFQDMTLTLNHRFTLKQDAFFLMALDDADDYRLTFSTTLSGKITNFLDISTTVRIEYDHSLASKQRYDQRVSTSLGYVF